MGLFCLCLPLFHLQPVIPNREVLRTSLPELHQNTPLPFTSVTSLFPSVKESLTADYTVLCHPVRSTHCWLTLSPSAHCMPCSQARQGRGMIQKPALLSQRLRSRRARQILVHVINTTRLFLCSRHK